MREKVPEIRVVGALCVRGERLLLARRLPGGPRGGMWEFPGGKVEPGESEADALARELLEELALAVTVGRAVSEGVHDYGDLIVHLKIFHCWPTKAGDEPRPVQAAEVAWVLPEALPGYRLTGADAALGAALAAQGLAPFVTGAPLPGGAPLTKEGAP